MATNQKCLIKTDNVNNTVLTDTFTSMGLLLLAISCWLIVITLASAYINGFFRALLDHIKNKHQ